MYCFLQDPTGTPVVNEKEATIQASKLPICNNHTSSHLASLRPIKKAIQRPNHLPFSSLENKLHLLQTTCQWSIRVNRVNFLPKIGQKFSSNTFIYRATYLIMNEAYTSVCLSHMHRIAALHTTTFNFQSSYILYSVFFVLPGLFKVFNVENL